MVMNLTVLIATNVVVAAIGLVVGYLIGNDKEDDAEGAKVVNIVTEGQVEEALRELLPKRTSKKTIKKIIDYINDEIIEKGVIIGYLWTGIDENDE